MTATTPPPLAPDLIEGLKRPEKAAMRRLAPELLVTTKTQRWNPEKFLRTVVEAEITARDESSPAPGPGYVRRRSRPPKTLADFGVAASSIPKATSD